MKINLLLLLSSFCFYPLLSMAVVPRRSLAANVNRVISQLNSKNYTVEGSRRFHIGLKRNESVRYIITVPVYLSKTAIGIATDQNVKKVRVVLYSQFNTEAKERSFYGEEFESSTFINEISEKSYHYVVELTLVDSIKNNDYSSIDLLVAYAPLPIKTEEELKDFYYDHTDEKEYYSDPIRVRNAGRRRSDTGRIPCTTLEYGRTCIR